MRNSVMTFTHLNDKNWSILFGDFAAEEAPMLADNIAEFSAEHDAQQFTLLNWREDINAVVNSLYEKNFVFMEGKDGHGEVVQRAVYLKRAAETRF